MDGYLFFMLPLFLVSQLVLSGTKKKNEKYIETSLIQIYNSFGRICVFSLKDWN